MGQVLAPRLGVAAGWEEVQRSWAAIFHSTVQMLISIRRPLVQILGDTAWVSCLEDVTIAQRDGISSALIEATNIFVRHRAGGYCSPSHDAASRKPDSSQDQILQ